MRWIADLRYSFRTLAKSPGFALIAILSLALGVGANSAMFSYVDALLLRPLPVSAPSRVIEVVSTSPGVRFDGNSYPDYADFRDQTKTLSALVCYSMSLMGVSQSRDQVPKVTLGIIASGNFFSGLGIEIPIGRGFRPEEDQTPGRDLVTVLSHSMWEHDFASSPAAIGRKIRINGSEFTIVGVAPKGFTGPEAFVLPQFYVPMNAFPQAIPNAKPDYLAARGNRELTVFGLLKPGVKVAAARAELNTIAARLAAQYPATNKDRSLLVANYQDARYQRNSMDATFAFLLLGVTTLVLLIACANVANLVLARGAGRVKEIAIRMAVGASRMTLVRQLLTESLVLAIAGGAAGLAVAYAGVRFLNSIPVPSDYPISLGVRMDARLLTFSFLLAVATGLIFGLIPALRSTRTDLSSTIKSSDQGPAKIGFLRGRLAGRNVLVTMQLTLSVVLLILSAFFVRGFQGARHMATGFRVDHTIFFSLDPNLVRYDEARSRQFYRKLIDRLRDTTGVRNASLSWTIPFTAGAQRTRGFLAEGDIPPAGKPLPSAWSNIVDENYFGLMETPIVRGRAFDARDTAASPHVAVINETLARKLWPGRDAIGKRVRLDRADGPMFEVIGVARDSKYLYWAEAPQNMVWTAFAQEYNSHMVVEVRTTGDPAAMAGAVRDAVRSIDPDMPIFNMSTMDTFFEDRVMLGPKLLAQTVTAIGLMGLLLAVIGLYGVVSYAVSRRTREIGVRMAIGARPADVLRMVLGQGMTFTAIGVVLGIVLAMAAGRFVQDFLVDASTKDPVTLIGVPLLLAAVMAIACWIPARRAARLDPTHALRIE
ncbi:MAG: ABC transporter permease [Acidobacteriia bacterium]|nr:ABC transporter permease [Terriglobia bacterium]